MKQNCAVCGSNFKVTDKDLTFLKEVSPEFAGKTFDIPPPTLCPECRFRRRIIWRAELHLHKYKSDKSGEEILAQYPPGCPRKVWSCEEWWSDDWDPLSFGRDFDFSRPFFDQFDELMREVPLMSRSVFGNENSDYINSASYCKNCYILAGANNNEDCYYGNFVNRCKSCVDNSFINDCELCYECLDCTHCYNCRYCQQSSNCSDSFFLFSCRGCKHCFGCVNLVEKEYHWLNEEVSKEEFEKRLADAKLHKRSRVEEAQQYFTEHRLKYPHKYMVGEMNENVTGNSILRSRRCFDCFDVTDSEDCKYCGWFHQAKTCMDCYSWGFPVERCYECMETGNGSYHNLFCVLMINCSDCLYSHHCASGTQHCFGCVSLRSKKYCVFNKQYTQEEYESLVAKIIEHMRATSEWGELFPMSLCHLPYNQSIAQDYLPLSKEEAQKLGARWDETEGPTPQQSAPIPDAIEDCDEKMCKEVFICEETGKPHRVLTQEFAFLKEHGIPIPTKCWFARHMARLHRRNPRKLWDRKCQKCGKDIRTSYSPERPEIVYCESCYLNEVY